MPAVEGRLQIEYVRPDALRPFAGNPRKISPRGLEKLQRSVEEFGFINPVIAQRGSGMVIAGHQRLKAAQAAGLTEVPVVWLDVDDVTAKAYNLADNRTAQESEWDFAPLADLLQELDTGAIDLALTGFDEEELRKLMEWTPEPESGEIAEDEVPEPPEEPVTKRGDIWVMGKHRLICGDRRDHGTVTKLFQNRTAAVVVTSPPYASQRTYDESSGFKPIHPDEYADWYRDVAANIMAFLSKDGSYFLNIKEHCEEGQRSLYVKDLVIAHVRQWGWRFVDEFVWTHGGTPKAVNQRFKNGWEPIFQFTVGRHKFRPENVMHPTDDIQKYGTTEGMRRKGVDARQKQPASNAKLQGTTEGGKAIHDAVAANTGGMAYPSNVLSLGKNREALGHPAAYPVGLPTFFIKAYSDSGDIIYDPFMGSGTTLVAAEKEGRIGYGCEISPAYCDVIVQRWENLTGQKARLER